MIKLFRDAFPRNVTREQSKDTGMAMVLLLLIMCLILRRQGLAVAAVVALVINMTFPQLYRPAAVVWFGLSHLLGTFVSSILLSAVFFAVVTPMGLVRKLLGKDSLNLKGFKDGDESVLLVRNHTFVREDIEKPY